MFATDRIFLIKFPHQLSHFNGNVYVNISLLNMTQVGNKNFVHFKIYLCVFILFESEGFMNFEILDSLSKYSN